MRARPLALFHAGSARLETRLLALVVRALLTARLATFRVALVLLRTVAPALVLAVQQPLARVPDMMRAGGSCGDSSFTGGTVLGGL